MPCGMFPYCPILSFSLLRPAGLFTGKCRVPHISGRKSLWVSNENCPVCQSGEWGKEQESGVEKIMSCKPSPGWQPEVALLVSLVLQDGGRGQSAAGSCTVDGK